jgi:hypothetical protein
MFQKYITYLKHFVFFCNLWYCNVLEKLTSVKERYIANDLHQ